MSWGRSADRNMRNRENMRNAFAGFFSFRFKEITPNMRNREGTHGGTMSRGLSRTARRLLTTHETDLWSRLPRSQRGARVFAYQRRALAIFLTWLAARG